MEFDTWPNERMNFEAEHKLWTKKEMFDQLVQDKIAELGGPSPQNLIEALNWASAKLSDKVPGELTYELDEN